MWARTPWQEGWLWEKDPSGQGPAPLCRDRDGEEEDQEYGLRNRPMPREVWASGEVTRNHMLSIVLLLKKKKILSGQPGPPGLPEGLVRSPSVKSHIRAFPFFTRYKREPRVKLELLINNKGFFGMNTHVFLPANSGTLPPGSDVFADSVLWSFQADFGGSP